MGDVVDDESFELVLVPDDGSVEEFAADGADPTFRERVGHGCRDGRPKDLESFGPEGLVDGSDELATPITNQRA